MQSLLRIRKSLNKNIYLKMKENMCIVSHHIESKDNDDHVPFEFNSASYKELDWIMSKYP
jgi:transglutaminase/protease-like cytokinesis protein 3